MTVSIGRFGLDLTTPVLASVEASGRTLRLSGYLKAASLAAGLTLRQQLLGLVGNPDEPVVPVVSTVDSSLNGFYRVLSADVTMAASGADYSNFVLPWSAELERAASGYNPLIERTLIAALRTNAHSITATNIVAFFGMPAAAQAAQDIATYFSGTSLTGADGALRFYYDSNPGASVYVNGFALNPGTAIATAGYYDNAAKLESKWADNSNYYPVVGRDVPARVSSAIRTGHDWRLSNGLVRVAPSVTTGALNCGCDLSVSHYDGSQWDTAKRYTFTLATVPLASALQFTQFTVLRNDPAAVSIRLSVEVSNLAWLLDLTLRRGSRFVECRWTLSTAGAVVVAVSTVEAATALTGGIRATSNDAAGNRYVLAGAQATTNDLTNGSITSGSVTSYDFMIGSEVGGSGAGGMETAQNQIYQYMCAQSETYRIVGR